jgi:hypothetical protein
MGSLKSVDNIPDIQYVEYRDTLYYNEYKYRAKFHIYGLRRSTFHRTINELVDRLTLDEEELKDFLLSLHKNSTSYYNKIAIKESRQIYDNIASLSKFMDWYNIQKRQKDTIFRIEHNDASVFSNNLELLKTLADIFDGDMSKISITQAIPSDLVGVKTFVKEPKHKFRVYVRSKIVPEDFRKTFSKILKTNKKTLFPSNSFHDWLTEKPPGYVWSYSNRYLHSNYYIDYDDESMITYLALIYGNILGKKYRLEKRPVTE